MLRGVYHLLYTHLAPIGVEFYGVKEAVLLRITCCARPYPMHTSADFPSWVLFSVGILRRFKAPRRTLYEYRKNEFLNMRIDSHGRCAAAD